MPVVEYRCPVCLHEWKHVSWQWAKVLPQACGRCTTTVNPEVEPGGSFVLRGGGVGWSKEGYSGGEDRG